MWQTTIGGNEKTSGYRHTTFQPLIAATFYVDKAPATPVWYGSCGQLTLMNATALASSVALVAGVVASLF